MTRPAPADTVSVTWETLANQLGPMLGREVTPGDRLAIGCPAKGATNQSIWGTDVYTDDSSVCVAAVHAGLINSRDGGMVVLVGGSSCGKTRCAFEAVRTLMPQWWLVHPSGPAQLAELALDPPSRTVVWLDELQNYLDGERGLTPAVLARLTGAGAVLVATLWPEIQRATLDIIGRAFGRVVSSKHVLDTISGFPQGAAR